MNRIAQVILLVASSFASAACAADELPLEPADLEEEEIARRIEKDRAEKLIDLLESNNKPLGRRGPVPSDYDRRSQTIVYLAGQQLLREGAAAFETLIEHFDDDRHSYSYHGLAARRDVTVGQTCQSIVNTCLRPFARDLEVARYENAANPWSSVDEFKEWWKTNHTRPMWEIQVEFIDREIEGLSEMTYEKWLTRSSSKSQLKPSEERYKVGRAKAVERLQRLKDSITLLKEPHYPSKFTDGMIGVPWPEKYSPY